MTSNQEKRRKRVNRIKYFILFFAVLLLISSVFLNVYLLFKVLHLEEQISQIYSFIDIQNMI